MDIIDMARASGMAVILDGRIGREEYQSVCGSLSALQRFAEAVHGARCATTERISEARRHACTQSVKQGRAGAAACSTRLACGLPSCFPEHTN